MYTIAVTRIGSMMPLSASQHAGPKLSGYATSTATRATVIQKAAVGCLRDSLIDRIYDAKLRRKQSYP